MKILFVIFFTLLIFSADLFSQTEGCLEPSLGQLSYAQLYSKDTLSLIEFPNMTSSYNLASNRVYFRLMGLDGLIDKKLKFGDVLFGMGIGFAPFKKILHLNLDYSLSYGIVGWNNFSGLIKPYAMLHIPILRSKDKKRGVDLTLAAGYYNKYSYKIIGYLGSDAFYKNTSGYFFQGGISFR
jgi:hypothetical protein